MTKINDLLQDWPKNAVVTSQWLLAHGITPALKQSYEKSGWIQSIGNGAVIRTNDRVLFEGGLHALQYQLHKAVHLGARSALERRGEGHYIRTQSAMMFLFIKPKVSLEKWFTHHPWDLDIRYIRTNILETDEGIEEEAVGEFNIKVSSTERAILEMLCFTPHIFSLEETSMIFEHLSWMRSHVIQTLLEKCQSYKGKRLFLFLGEYFNHSWIKKLDLEKIDLGKGKKSLLKGGVFNKKYLITLPKEFMKNEESPLF